MSPYYFIYFTVLPEVVMAATEVESAIFRFMSSLGQGTDWDPEEFDSICEMIPAFKFGILVTGENIKVTFIAEVFYYINYVNINYSVKNSTVDCKYLLYFL